MNEHATERRGLPDSAKAGLAVLALVGLFVLVALGARGSHPVGHARIAERRVPARVSDDLLTILMIVEALGLLIFCAALFAFRRTWRPVKSRWLRDFVVMLGVIILLTLVGYRLIHSRTVHNRAQQAARSGAGQRRGRGPRPLSSPRAEPAHFDWQLGLGLAGLALLGGVYYLVRVRRTERVIATPDEAVEDELSRVVRDAIDDLLNEADARRAVIAAYARMEGVLGRHGLPRRSAEAPFEYLGRVLGSLRVRASAVQDLTELFERAKFSTHAIDAPMKERAIKALVSVRDDLQAAAA